MRVVVFGAGAWGSAIARHAALRHEVLIWARDPELADAIAREHRNARYLPGQFLGAGLLATADLAQACTFAGTDGLFLVATPMAALRNVLEQIRVHAAAVPTPLFWLCKGLELPSGLLAHELATPLLGARPAGVLSGPSFAQEVAAGLPFALVAASPAEVARERMVAALHHEAGRIYVSEDLIGVELAGALKNVIAIAAGACDGLGLGLNARAALLTRGLAEITRLGVLLGANPSTFLGLAGLGDLILTCTGDLSRNRRVGLGLAQGHSLEGILATLGHVAEGVGTTAAVYRLAARHSVEMPIVAAVHSVLFDRVPVRTAVSTLLAREPGPE